MTKENLKGALFFSSDPPHVTGYIVIGNVEFEIAGWRASSIRSEITARERGLIQTDIFGDARTGDGDGVERGGEEQLDRADRSQGRPDPAG